jgi:sterol desaturase/sphingolipid hydroxylase (fatty acid hydroxylase superfamily)
MRSFLFFLAERFPKGSIWQTRYITFPFVIVASTAALTHTGLGMAERLAWFALGLLGWTFLEYVLHRWVLHWNPRTKLGEAFLKRLHILHHDEPADQTQVCIPLAMSVPLWAVFYGLLILLGGGIEASLIATCGVALMMTIYDIAHFSAHYMQATNGYLKLLKKHHALHHFSDHTRRFGVTSPFWDYVFRTHR